MHQIDSLQVLALQLAAEIGNTNMKLPRGIIMGETRFGFTSIEGNEVSRWRNIELYSGYNMPYRQNIDRGATIAWYDTFTNKETITIGTTTVYTIHSGCKLTWSAPKEPPYCRIVWVDVTNTDEAIQNLAYRSYIKNAFGSAYATVEKLKSKARDHEEGSMYDTPCGTATRGKEMQAELEDAANPNIGYVMPIVTSRTMQQVQIEDATTTAALSNTGKCCEEPSPPVVDTQMPAQRSQEPPPPLPDTSKPTPAKSALARPPPFDNHKNRAAKRSAPCSRTTRTKKRHRRQ